MKGEPEGPRLKPPKACTEQTLGFRVLNIISAGSACTLHVG